jgi:hypothetical protein
MSEIQNGFDTNGSCAESVFYIKPLFKKEENIN